jgi:hypothetical protein
VLRIVCDLEAGAGKLFARDFVVESMPRFRSAIRLADVKPDDFVFSRRCDGQRQANIAEANNCYLHVNPYPAVQYDLDVLSLDSNCRGSGRGSARELSNRSANRRQLSAMKVLVGS